MSNQNQEAPNNSTERSHEDDLAADVHAAQQAVAEDQQQSDETQRMVDELKEANDRALRAQAELENFRRRLRREMDEERRYASLPLISDLLQVVDNLERAMEAAEKSETASSLLEGVKMVYSQFLSILERHNCRRIGEVGATFDPNEHEALAQEPSSQFEAGKVTRVHRFGYRLNDRVVRPAQVLVSSGVQK